MNESWRMQPRQSGPGAGGYGGSGGAMGLDGSAMQGGFPISGGFGGGSRILDANAAP